MTLNQVSPVYFLTALAGAVVIFIKDRGLAWIVLAFLVLDMASKVAMSILDPQNPDAYGYMLPAFAMTFVFAAAAVVPLWQTRLRSIAAALTLGLAIVPLVIALPQAIDRLGFRDTETYIEQALRPVPKDSTVIQSFYPTFFATLYAQSVQGLRPDTLFVQGSFYKKSGGLGLYTTRICAKRHDFCPIIRRFEDTGTLDWSRIQEFARKHTTLLEPAQGMEAYLAPLPYQGFYFAFHGPAITAETFVTSLHKAFGAPRDMDLETRRVLLRLHYLSAMTLLAGHHGETARILARECLLLNPNDTAVKELNRLVTR